MAADAYPVRICEQWPRLVRKGSELPRGNNPISGTCGVCDLIGPGVLLLYPT